MSRQPLKFRESDLRRAIRAASKEGASVTVEIDAHTGNIRLLPLTSRPEPKEINPWDK